ncbi:DUF86 domain-containing protein [Candidatus Woesearchaeota archaeon]|nr:DUF86 domain-containing protein [Candidatus Woesearchaeota archaeon]
MEQEKRLLSKIDEMDQYLKELQGIELPPLKEYSASVTTKRACERLLQMLIETLIDMAYILHRMKRLGIPKDDDSIIHELTGKGILDGKTAGLILALKGFRNILVHKYGEVDDELVYENLKEHLDDFESLKNFFLKQAS